MSNIESNERVVLDPPESTIDEDWLEQEVGGDGRGGADCQDVPALAPADWSEPDECIDTEQVPVGLRAKALAEGNAPLSLALYGLLGLAFGILLVKSEVVSWFRIQEMFRFDAFHMYGIIGSAVATAAFGIAVIRRFQIRTLHGEPIEIPDKVWGSGTRYWAGGIVFGLGWALLGACPGPMFALMGGGVTVMVVAIVSAVAGTWVYGALRPHLPH